MNESSAGNQNGGKIDLFLAFSDSRLPLLVSTVPPFPLFFISLWVINGIIRIGMYFNEQINHRIEYRIGCECMQSSGGLLICLPFSLSFFRGLSPQAQGNERRTDSASHGNAGEMIGFGTQAPAGRRF